MEVQKRRRYTSEFKQDVVNLIKTGDKRISEISRDLEISEAILYRWYKKFTGNGKVDAEKLSEKDKEVRSLRRQLADVMEERDILKKAISIFSKQGKSG
jgi:transposase